MKPAKVLILAREQAKVDDVLLQLQKAGLSAVGTIKDETALLQLDAGDIGALVIGGGVEGESRRRVQTLAEQKHVRVIEGALRGKDPESYVRDELVPQLRRIAP